MRMFKKSIGRKVLTTAFFLSLMSGLSTSVFAVDPGFVNNNDPGMPVFTNPTGTQIVPTEPAPYNASQSMMMDMYQADLAAGGTSFWMDRLLARKGNDPTGTYLMTRGKALYAYTNSASVIGFGNNIAYFDLLNQKGYSIQIPGVTFTQDSSKRLQTPSYWSAFYNATGYTLEETKFITDNNVAVDNIMITNTTTSSKTFTLTADSPFATTASADGTELTGTFNVRNNLTKVYPRLSGTGMTASNGILTRSITLAPNEKISLKFQMGFITSEIPESTTDYNRFRAYDPNTAYVTQLREYNKWWADYVPYIDVPDDNIKKIIYYRWWLNRFNFLDANIPGNDYQFPISVEGALGYNNAIVLSQPMHMQDLKYFRSPYYSYGDWVSAGETARDSLFTDNPGKPSNWNNSYSQYIGDSAFQTYEVHGGQPKILNNLAHYAEKDAKGQLDRFDTNKDGVINYDWGSLTGNDGDGNAFHYFEKRGNIDQNRTEDSFVYGNAMASAKAYQLAGNTAKANEMFTLADTLKTSFLATMWDNSSNMFLQKDLQTNTFIPWKEANNYYAFQMDGLVPTNDPKYLESLRYWGDKAELPVFPFYTADQKDKATSVAQGVGGTNNFSNINASGDIRLFTEVLRKYPNQPYITADMYKKLMYWLGWADAYQGNINYLDNNEYWYNWNATTKQIDGRSGIHHNILGNYNYSIIEDIGGLVPRADANVELWPIDIGWNHFTVNNLRYHGNDVTITWDKPGDGTTYYPGVQEGYSMYVNGSLVFRTDKLAHLQWDPATGDVTILDASGAAVAEHNSNAQMKAAADVDLNTYNKAADLFQKAGVDVTPETGSAVNIAMDPNTQMTASYTNSLTKASNTNNGFTISGNFFTSGAFTANPPIWGTKGSTNAQEWLQADFGSPKTLDDIKLYFYNDKPDVFYREPSMYVIQYFDNATSSWLAVPKQYKSPLVANYNHIQFPAISAQKIRVLMTPQPGTSVGIKELQAFSTGVQAPDAVNTPPVVIAQQDTTASIPLKAKLVTNIKDDGLPASTISSTWVIKSGVAGGQATFSQDASGNTIASFNRAGSYVLTLTVSDGELSTVVDVPVTITPLPTDVNLALQATPSTSYVSSWENLNAINDGRKDPTSSTDKGAGAYGNWNHSSATEWVEYTWGSPVNISKSDVYWWTDNGGVLAPTASKLQYWNGIAYVDVPNAVGNGVALNKYNSTTFSPITTTKLRMTITRGAQWTGILQWKVYATPTISVNPVKVSTLHDVLPVLPPTVTKNFADGSTATANVIWDPVTPDQVASPGSFTVKGVVDGTNIEASATVYVRVTNEVSITSIADSNVTTLIGQAPILPKVIEATYNDGSVDNINVPVTWNVYDPSLLSQPGTFTILGTVAGSSVVPKVNVTVNSRPIASIPNSSATTIAGVAPILPDKVNVVYDNGFTGQASVVWTISPSQYAAAGTVTINGAVAGTSIVPKLTLTVVAKTVTSITPVNVTTEFGVAPILPTVVTATYNDTSTASLNVTWDEIDPAKYASAGTFQVNGTVAGSSIPAVAIVTVNPMNVITSKLMGPSDVNQDMYPGQSFDLTYGLNNVDPIVAGGIYAEDLTINYDPAQLQLSAVTALIDGIFVSQSGTPGHIRIVSASEGAAHVIKSANSGAILKLSFQANAANQPTISTVALSDVVVSDSHGIETQVQGASSSVHIMVVDKTTLTTLIATAQAKYDAAVEGSNPGQYPAGSKAALQAAIATAQAVVDNAAATPDQVSQAATNLNTSLQSFLASIHVAQPGDVNGDNRFSIGDLAIVASHYGETVSDPNWLASVDINHDGVIDVIDLATVAHNIISQ
ncbi:hypothetical protein A8709_17405 [Paenibacillus pectinilyticus]|uniref:Dockerin domain-containing protein n=1 Tax=Paenibacillus pectinilyticus TaxID=512399 RepID=A0A1C0ZZ55_9BACL|nr:Ig-like domain-containing protein [Paenibacillus pectinilyticus]OCT13390.1 hypothetical protein A8709_17405 [Paenibacillus pectinilyticus]